MRRVFVSLLGFVFVTAILVGLKSTALVAGQGHAIAGAPLDPAGPSGAVDASGNPPPGGGPVSPGALRPTNATGSPLPAATNPSRSPAPGGGGGARPTPSATTTTTTVPPASANYTGMAVAVKTAQSPTTKSSPCGDCHDYAISVTITVSGGRITAATASFSTSLGGSQSYANRACNALNPAVVSSQTWSLGRVSGATYSSNAWELSARDAMAKAGL